MPMVRPVAMKSSSSLKNPSIDELHSYASTVPSLSDPVPLKVTSASNLAGDGVIESIVAIGGVIG